MTEHDKFNCSDSGCEDHYMEASDHDTTQDASEEINIKPPSPELEALVAETLEGIHGRSFSARNPELGKMFRCAGCNRRHRGSACEIKYKYLHTEEDLETGEKTDIFATVPLPEQIERGLRQQPPKTRFPKAIMGAAMVKGRRKRPHFSAVKLQFIEITRKVFQGDPDPESEGYQDRLNKARKKASRVIRKKNRVAGNAIRRQQELSRRLNRGFAKNRA